MSSTALLEKLMSHDSQSECARASEGVPLGGVAMHFSQINKQGKQRKWKGDRIGAVP